MLLVLNITSGEFFVKATLFSFLLCSSMFFSNQVEAFSFFDIFGKKETKLEETVTELSKNVSDNKKVLAELRLEIDAIKKEHSALSSEIAAQIENQKQAWTDSKELGHILVKYGNNPDAMTVLHYAIKLGDIHAVNLLLANGADVNSRDLENGRNFTALARAAFYNQFEIAKLLIDLGADAGLRIGMAQHDSEIKFDALYYAAQKGSASIINLLIESNADLDISYDSYGSPLHVASKAGNYEAVVALISAGADINMIRNSKDKGPHQPHWMDGTPLDFAAYNLTYSENPKNLDLIKFLVEHGATRTCTREIKSCSVINEYLKSQGK